MTELNVASSEVLDAVSICCCSRWRKTPSSTAWEGGRAAARWRSAPTESDSVCIFVINDNGVSHAAPEQGGLGIGLENIRSRLRILYGTSGRLSASRIWPTGAQGGSPRFLSGRKRS